MRLTTDRTKPVRNIVPDSGFHERRVILVAEFLEPSNVRDDLRHTDAHVLELAEAESLPVRRGNADIRRIVEEIDLLILEGQILRGDDQAIPVELERHLLQTELALKELEQPPAALLALVAHGKEIQRFRRVFHEQLHEGHDQDVVTLSRLIPVEIQKEEHIVRELELLAGEFAGHREICG